MKVFKSYFYCLVVGLALSIQTAAQSTEFTYQGRLLDNSLPPTAAYDFEFKLYDALANGTQLGATQQLLGVPVTNGIFTVRLNFGAQFPGAARFIEISVKNAPGPFTVLAPRQPLTSAPYSIRSSNAASANSVTCTLCITDAHIVSIDGAKVTGTVANATNAAQLGGVPAASYLQTNGDGSGLTNLNASNIASGTIPDARLSSFVARRNVANTFTGAQTINGNLTQTGTATNLTLTNGFVTSGTFGSGSIPATGGGTRMMFYPGNAAFRAGNVSGTQWDDANIGNYSTAMGDSTTASGLYSTAMGQNTIASGSRSTALGLDTTASHIASTAMGIGTTASGLYSTAMGDNTTASGDYSTAMGRIASTNGFAGSFVYGDSSTLFTGALVNASATNQWTIRASGGYRFFTNPGLTTGVTLSAGGGSWTSVSDRNAKDNINLVNPREILRGVLRLPISTWNYKGQPQFRHIGAMAQDFYSTFNVGENDKTITTVDPDGVALAAIQGLNEKLTDELKDRDLKIEQLQQQLNALKKLVCAQNPAAELCKPAAEVKP